MTRPTRRANGTGSLYQRPNGTWAGIADFGLIGGARCRKVVYAKTRGLAARKLQRLIADGPNGKLDPTGRWNERRAAALKAAAGIETHTLEQWLAKRNAIGCCIYCGSPGPLVKDHATPVTRGGSNGIANVVPACNPCNVSKGASTAAEYLRRVLP